ncbi:hypothetical protein NliqN6_5484 [Naganishia liquefaciens]|uniref:Uncharacterized protein n=1 Tax=Naganishia liquefaciens TaxID=104408 RepID=A0A8H3YID0_9TREE|nr:hypothetical protein NliqN6_5484 [Naganishia liquefaciens]
MSISIPSEAQLAYNTVLKGDPKVEWAIFSLASAGNELKLQGTGSGLDDLEEEFMDGRIQYAFARVEDPNSNLEKFVQINWCGEGVPERQKGHFNIYASQIASFLKNSHIVIQARNEADITPEHIHKRLNESSGSKYTSAPAPVSSAPKPTPKPYTAPSSSFVRPIPGTTPSFQRSSAPSPAISQPAPTAAPAPAQAAPIASANTPAPEPTKSVSTPAPEDRIAPVGTAYTPVSLPKPKKLGNRWGPGAVPVGGSDDDEPHKAGGADVPKASAFASARSAFGGGSAPAPPAVRSFGGVGGAVGGGGGGGDASSGKKLTWSERQAEAKREREAEEKAAQEAMSKAASAAPARAFGGTSSGAVNTDATAALSPEEQEAAAASPPAPPAAPLPPRVPVTADDDEEKERDNEDDWDDAPPAPPPPAPFRPPAAPAPKAEEPAVEEEDAPPPPPPPPPPPTMPEQEDPAIAQLHKMQENLRLDESGIPAAPPAPPVPVATRPNVAVKDAGIQAKAEYDYEAAEENEVSFQENDILTQIEQTDADWWTGTNPQGQRGLFPANYVTLLEGGAAEEEEPAPPAAPAPPPMPSREEPAAADKGKWAIAQYDYDAAEDNEISMREGEEILDIEETDEAWWTGTTANGQRGLFPSNYVELQG